MEHESLKYNLYIINNVIDNNKFNITELNNLENLNSIFFLKEEYSKIEKIIKEGNIEAVQAFKNSSSANGEYLDIIMFNDQNGKCYILTVYDSNSLEQDPQIIEIYPFIAFAF